MNCEGERKTKGLTVSDSTEGSIAEEMGITQGDTVRSVNGFVIHDILDYQFLTNDSLVNIELRKKNGEIWELEIEKDFDQDIGISFTGTGLETITRCTNKCIFCFVDQMPKGMRKSLYVKDDDYRLSFLQGSFITLANLTEKDFEKIIRLRLSPLYVSVHTTNPELRKKVLGSPRAGDILTQLKRLTDEGIEVHAQAVICPGVNDGIELERTIKELSHLWPGVKSLAVVPVGLTNFRQKLFNLEKFKQIQAAAVINKIEDWQNNCLKTFDYPFVFASDEFYFLAEKEIPSLPLYADFPQIENGVGLTRLFLDQWNTVQKQLPTGVNKPLSVTLVTGMLGKLIMEPVAKRLNQIDNLKVSVLAVQNNYFGPSVTVSGLLTGSDVLNHREALTGSQLVLLPATMLKMDSPITLDDISLNELEKRIGTMVRSAQEPEEILETILEITGG